MLKKTIDISNLKAFAFTFISLAILIEPNYFAQNKGADIIVTVDLIYDILKVVVSIIIILVYLLYMKYIRNKVTVLLVIFQILLLISTFMNGLSVYEWFREFRTVAVTVLLINMMVCLGFAGQVTKAISVLFGIYGYVSIITYFLFPKGLYTHELGYKNCWFLGYKNIAVPILITGIVFAVYYSVTMYGRLSTFTYSVIISSVAYIFLVFSVTGIIVSALCIVLIIINKKYPRIFSFITTRHFLIANIILFPLLVVFRVQDKISLFTSLIEGFGKNLTFSGRTGLWDYALRLFEENWIMGIGIHEGKFYAISSGLWWAVHLHSYYLQIMVEGGMVALLYFFLFLYYVCRRFDTSIRSNTSSILQIGFLSFLVAFQLETYGQVAVFYILTIFMYNSDLVEQSIMQTSSISSEYNLIQIETSAYES